MGKLFITEKPSAAKALMEGLCAAHKCTSARRQGFYDLSNGDIVVWLHGHMIAPEFIPAALKKLNREEYFAHLPFRATELKYEPVPERNKDGSAQMRNGKPVPAAQYKVVSDLIKRAKEIVNAGDTDREGQLIVDELLLDCGVDPTGKNKPIWRLPLVSNKLEDVRDLVLSMSEKNGDPKWVRRRLAAFARQQCDMLVGSNGSMAFQAASGYARAAVGRVQTPVVCLIVDRERALRAFKPSNFYIPVITLSDGTEMEFQRREGSEGQPGFDEKGRIIDEALARQMVGMISAGMKGRISAANLTKSKEAPPMPFTSTVLFSTVSKRTGCTPKQAEDAAQKLYNAKRISYVGTDCKFLPTSMLEDARAVMTTLSRAYPRQAGGANLALRSKAWDDSKLDEHHAIIPTDALPPGADAVEKAVYDAVATRYMAQFYPAAEHVTHQLAAIFGADTFQAKRKECTVMGWKEVEGHLEQGGPGSDDGGEEEEQDAQAVRVRETASSK